MANKVFLIILIIAALSVVEIKTQKDEVNKVQQKNLVVKLTDEKWDQIQKGLWLIGFFDTEKESKELDDHWQVFAQRCKEYNINVGTVFAPENPGLYVRFLVTSSPKVFYVKNGVAHEIPKVSKETILELIKDQKWSKLKPVTFLSNPFSVQMSLLSHLFIHAVNLYNFENSIVQKFISAPSATDVVFGLTFIFAGTFLGLLMTCAFAFLQFFFTDSKESDEKYSDDEEEEEKEEETKKDNESSGKDSDVRKRK